MALTSVRSRCWKPEGHCCLRKCACRNIASMGQREGDTEVRDAVSPDGACDGRNGGRRRSFCPDRGYLNDCCPKETAESLRDTGSFYDAVRYHSGRKPWASELTSLYLLPEAADPSALPIRRNAPEGALTMASFGLEQLDRTPCVLLLASPVQAVLARCAASTGVPFQEIPLDDEAVYAALARHTATAIRRRPWRQPANCLAQASTNFTRNSSVA